MVRVRNPNAPKQGPARPDHVFLLLAEDVTSEEARAIRNKIMRASVSARSFFSTMSDDDGVASFNAIIKVPLVAGRRTRRGVSEGE